MAVEFLGKIIGEVISVSSEEASLWLTKLNERKDIQAGTLHEISTETRSTGESTGLTFILVSHKNPEQWRYDTMQDFVRIAIMHVKRSLSS